MEGRAVDNITEATPAEVDTEIANLSTVVRKLRDERTHVVRYVLTNSGLRERVPPTKYGQKSTFRILGTFEQGVEILRKFQVAWQAYRDSDYNEAMRPERIGDGFSHTYDVDMDEIVAKKDRLDKEIDELNKQIDDLNHEWVRRGRWSRMFLVTSSPGHIHRDTHCNTCRVTTEFGWMPQYSGLSQTELLATLGDYAEAACTVCYPDAPIKGKGKKVTVAKAEKMIAGPVLRD